VSKVVCSAGGIIQPDGWLDSSLVVLLPGLMLLFWSQLVQTGRDNVERVITNSDQHGWAASLQPVLAMWEVMVLPVDLLEVIVRFGT